MKKMRNVEVSGKRARGRPKKKFIDKIREDKCDRKEPNSRPSSKTRNIKEIVKKCRHT